MVTCTAFYRSVCSYGWYIFYICWHNKNFFIISMRANSSNSVTMYFVYKSDSFLLKKPIGWLNWNITVCNFSVYCQFKSQRFKLKSVYASKMLDEISSICIIMFINPPEEAVEFYFKALVVPASPTTLVRGTIYFCCLSHMPCWHCSKPRNLKCGYMLLGGHIIRISLTYFVSWEIPWHWYTCIWVK